MAGQVTERSAVLTQDDFQIPTTSGGILSAQMVSTLDGTGRVTFQNGQQQVTLHTEDIEAFHSLVTAVAARTVLYRQSVNPERFTTGG